MSRSCFYILLSIISSLFIFSVKAQNTEGDVVLSNVIPATPVLVVASNSITLKPGFRASGVHSTFNAKIEAGYSDVPYVNVSSGVSFWSGGNQIPNSRSTIEKNYIKTITYLAADNTYPNSTYGGFATMESIQYFDGLGRHTQTVDLGAAGNAGDLVLLYEYDNAGRLSKEYLPLSKSGNFGRYLGNDIPEMTEYAGNSILYATKQYEPSALNRIKSVQGAGDDWFGTSINYSYETNVSDVNYYTVENGQLKCNGKYAENTLYITNVYDEDEKQTIEFKNVFDQLVLTRKVNGSENIDTYYVYNKLGRLSYVITPMAVELLSEVNTTYSDSHTAILQYCYSYKYDRHGNCIEKVLPGCAPIYMVYDRANRLILSQDGNQRAKSQWTVTKYDVLGREIYKGYINREISNSEKEFINANVITETIGTTQPFGNTGYTCVYFQSEIVPLTVNYYDDYSFLNNLSNNVKTALSYENKTDFSSQFMDNEGKSLANGMLTGTRIYIPDVPELYTVQAMYYDHNGNIVQSLATNYKEGYEKSYFKYNYIGKVLKNFKEHYNTAESTPITELYTTAYTHNMLPASTSYSLNGGTSVTLAKNTYDEIGRLTEKKRHNGTDTESYEYNIRNMLTRIQSADFVQNLFYNSNLPDGVEPCFNGNIAYSNWTYNNSTQGYAYSYDGVNRLNDAAFYRGSSLHPNGSFDERYTYDKLGNITTLLRFSSNTLVDSLTFVYAHNNTSNQLERIDDSKGAQDINTVKEYRNVSKNTTPEFAYDANGNMTKDADRDIVAIQYNLLNLPNLVQFRNGNQIRNLYDASGQKLRSEFYTRTISLPMPLDDGQVISDVSSSNGYELTGTEYLGNMEYTFGGYGANYSHTLEQIYNDEGYIVDISSPKYHYYRRDHLGNNREVWLANTAQTIQRTQYYPSGLPLAYNTGDNPGEQDKKYNGKEFVEMHGLDEYDSEARWYYPAVMRTTTLDPLCEKYYDNSPYSWCSNNPISRIDPDGMTDYYNQNGTFVRSVEDNNVAKKMLFVTSKKEKDINNSINNGNFIDVPSNEVVSKMEDAYKITEKNGKEHGFRVGEKGSVSVMVEGNNSSIEPKDWIPAIEDLKAKNDYVAYDVHTHPKPEYKEGSADVPYNNLPSGTDKDNIVGSKPNVVLGYDFTTSQPSGQVGGMPTVKYHRSIGFFNSDGLINPKSIKFSDFKSAVKKINK